MPGSQTQASPQILLKIIHPITAFDRKIGSLMTVEAGEHIVERVSNPFGNDNTPWLVIVGTDVGASEAYWENYPDIVAISEV